MNDIKWCLSIILERHFYMDRWIGDETLLSILQTQFQLKHINKRYLNMYLQNIVIKSIKSTRHIEENINFNGTRRRRAYFYFFTASQINPTKLSRDQFIHCYFNTPVMRINNQRKKRSALVDISHSVNNNQNTNNNNAVIVSPPTTRRRITITDVIGNWFTSKIAKKLFSINQNETVYHCLSRRIDIFNGVLSGQKCISTIVNKASKEDGKLSHTQIIRFIHKIQGLKFAYLDVLSNFPNQPVNFATCCYNSIVKLKELSYDSVTNSKNIMSWNRIFRKNEKFPHPNIYVEMGKTYQPQLLEAFPETKIALRQWATVNLSTLNSNKVWNHIKNHVFPNLHEIYLNDCRNYDNQPTLSQFLHSFGLKNFCVTTAWKWMCYLGFTFDERTKSYFSDKHEHEENVQARKSFIEKYFEYEKQSHRWVHLTEQQAVAMENREEENLLQHIYYEFEEDNIKYREYHMDSHIDFLRMEKKLSVRHDDQCKPLIIIGQDESVFKQHLYGRKCWHGPNGEQPLLPKSDGYSQMVSAFASREFGLGLHVTEEQLIKINERRNSTDWCEYISKADAVNVQGTIKKKMISDKLTLVRFFDVGINEEGYWNFSHMALQIEDLYDVMEVCYPQFDFLVLMDQSSGHGKHKDDGLNAQKMSVSYGGSQTVMRNTKIKEIGPYECILEVGMEQKMAFQEEDDGPFYLSENEKNIRRYDTFVGNHKVCNKTKRRLLDELKEKGFQVKGYYSRNDLENHARQYNIDLTYLSQKKIEGWVGKPKGLLQILWERGYIDINNLNTYSLKGKKNHFDDNGKLKAEYEKYSLRLVMSRCSDFIEEESAMEHLFHLLSSKGQSTLKMLTSPKYHCELAGEGIEYCWGMAKRMYRSIDLLEKNTKQKFDEHVRMSIEHVNIESVILFSGKGRRYMMVYQNNGNNDECNNGMTYESIEKFQKKFKTHRNVADIDRAFIEREWQRSIQ